MSMRWPSHLQPGVDSGADVVVKGFPSPAWPITAAATAKEAPRTGHLTSPREAAGPAAPAEELDPPSGSDAVFAPRLLVPEMARGDGVRGHLHRSLRRGRRRMGIVAEPPPEGSSVDLASGGGGGSLFDPASVRPGAVVPLQSEIGGVESGGGDGGGKPPPIIAEAGSSMLMTILCFLVLAPCLMAAVAQVIYKCKKRKRDRVERQLEAVSTNPNSRMLVLSEIFKNNSKPVTEDDASPKKKRVLVKKHRKKTGAEKLQETSEDDEEARGLSDDSDRGGEGSGGWLEGGDSDKPMIVYVSSFEHLEGRDVTVGELPLRPSDEISSGRAGQSDVVDASRDTEDVKSWDKMVSCLSGETGALEEEKDDIVRGDEGAGGGAAPDTTRTSTTESISPTDSPDESDRKVKEQDAKNEEDYKDPSAHSTGKDSEDALLCSDDSSIDVQSQGGVQAPSGSVTSGDEPGHKYTDTPGASSGDEGTAASGSQQTSLSDPPKKSQLMSAEAESAKADAKQSLDKPLKMGRTDAPGDSTDDAKESSDNEILGGSTLGQIFCAPDIPQLTSDDVPPKSNASIPALSPRASTIESDTKPTTPSKLTLPNLWDEDSVEEDGKDAHKGSIFRAASGGDRDSLSIPEIEGCGSSVTEVTSNVDAFRDALPSSESNIKLEPIIRTNTNTGNSSTSLNTPYQLTHVNSGASNLSGPGGTGSYVSTTSSNVSYFSYEDVSVASEESEMCAICLCPYEEGDIRIFSKRCPHVFHKECILEWLVKSHTECPCCRKEMITKSEIKETSASLIGTERLAQAMAVVSGSEMQEAPPFRGIIRPQLARQMLARARAQSRRMAESAQVPPSPTNNAHWLWTARFNGEMPNPAPASASSPAPLRTLFNEGTSTPRTPRSGNGDWLWATRFGNTPEETEQPRTINPSRSSDAIMNPHETNQSNADSPRSPAGQESSMHNTAGSLFSSSMYHDHWHRRASTQRQNRNQTRNVTLSPQRRHSHWRQNQNSSHSSADADLPVATLPPRPRRHSHWRLHDSSTISEDASGTSPNPRLHVHWRSNNSNANVDADLPVTVLPPIEHPC